MGDKLTFEELEQETTNKYKIRYLQAEGFFTPDQEGLYDERWVEFFHEARQYRSVGFNELDANCTL